ncbi:MAG: hypothetical protein EXQ94_10535 [Alphaproteobacteria bacterium]|nr:hypothetical protein [Alphaproteobacteria bacterium]
MMHRILRATARPDFSVVVVFEGGEHAIIDLAGFVADGDSTRRLRDGPGFFVSALAVIDDGDALGWPDDRFNRPG